MKWIYRLLLKNKFLYRYMSIATEKRFEYLAGYADKNGIPLECFKCGCKEFKEADHDYLDGHILCEYSIRCKNCNQQVGYWAYGNWQL